MNWMYAHFHCAGFKEFLFKPQSLQYFMIRTWFNTNTVLCHNFVLSWNALRLIVNTEDQWSDTERLPYGAINLCFFYCNRCKGLSGSITFPGQLSFSVLNRVLRESFFTRYNIWILLARYWHLSLSVCTINPTYRNLFTTSSLWHFLLPDLLDRCTWSSYHSLRFL